jgi:hypothetical protein
VYKWRVNFIVLRWDGGGEGNEGVPICSTNPRITVECL